MTPHEEEIVRRAHILVAPFGCRVVGIGPDSVGIREGARFMGPTLIVTFPKDMGGVEVERISKQLTSEISEIACILREAPTSLLAASLEDVRKATKSGLRFPAMAIPFGADEHTICRFFSTDEELIEGEAGEEEFRILLSDSYPMFDGVRRVHIISARQTSHSDLPLNPFVLTPKFSLLNC